MSVAALAVPGGGVCILAPTMMIKETSLRRDPDLRGELAFLARGCDFVLPSRFKKRLKSFQQQQVSRCSGQHGLTVSLDVQLMINILQCYKFLSCFSFTLVFPAQMSIYGFLLIINAHILQIHFVALIHTE